jgi:hypothetical protein
LTTWYTVSSSTPPDAFFYISLIHLKILSAF